MRFAEKSDGMLEQSALLLRRGGAWPAAAMGLSPERAVLDAATGEPLGVAGWRAEPPRWWPRWLRRPVLAVHESGDAPLLFTVHRCWGLAPHWEVRDADGHVLGLLYGPLVKDRFGRNLAVVERSAAGGPVRVRDRNGRELLALTPVEEEERLAFGPEAEGNPFLKMVLLAAALVLER